MTYFLTIFFTFIIIHHSKAKYEFNALMLDKTIIPAQKLFNCLDFHYSFFILFFRITI